MAGDNCTGWAPIRFRDVEKLGLDMPKGLKNFSWMRHPVLTDATLYIAVVGFVLLAYGTTAMISRFSN